jgi:prepilin-type N-terminal cleavage/methylation domain-containing protein
MKRRGRSSAFTLSVFPGRYRRLSCHPSPVTRHAAFTLLELLVVMGIIALLLAALIPTVNISKSTGRKGAVSNLVGAFEQARSLAIKDGRPAYVVLTTNLSSTDQNLVQRYSYRSYAIFEDEEDPAKPGTFKQKQSTEWKVLPTGVSLRSDISATPWVADIDFPFTPEGASKTEKFPYLKFNSSGQVDSPAPANGQIQLRIFEGYVSAGGSEHMTSSKNFDETITIGTVSGRSTYTSANQ